MRLETAVILVTAFGTLLAGTPLVDRPLSYVLSENDAGRKSANRETLFVSEKFMKACGELSCPKVIR